MLRSVALATLRTHLRTTLVWGFSLCALIVLLVVLHWRSEVPTHEERQRLMEQVSSGGLGFMQIMFGEIGDLTVFGGFAEWYGLGLMPLLAGVVMVLCSTATGRGREERGETELLATMPLGRHLIFVGQAIGLLTVLGVLSLLIWLALLLSAPFAGESMVRPGDAALAALNVASIAALFGALGLLMSQLTNTRRAAASIAGALLVAAQLWANIGLLVAALDGWRWLSPLYLYSRGSPLTGEPSYGALAVLLSGSIVVAAVAGFLFVRRDLGDSTRLSFVAVRRRQKGGTWLLGGPLQSRARSALSPAIPWAVGMSVYTAVFTVVTPPISEALEGQAGARELLESLGAGDATTDASIVTFTLFAWLPMLLGIFAVTLASSFASGEREGRFELEATLPASRTTLYLSHAAASMLAITLIATMVTIVFLGAVWMAELNIGGPRAIAAAGLMTLPAWVVFGLGLFLAGWRPGLAAPVATGTLVGSFFFDILAEPLGVPELARNVSVFQLYGRPLLDGVRGPETVVMLSLIAVFLIAGSFAFSRRDILK